MRNADLLLMEDRRYSVALSADKCLRVTKGIVVGPVLNTCPIESVGGIFENASVRRSAVKEFPVNASRGQPVFATGVADVYKIGGDMMPTKIST